MYVIFEDGARQYKASQGQTVTVDFRRDETAPEGELRGVKAGTKVELNRVLFYKNGDDLRIGQPVVEGAHVIGEVVDHPSTKTYIGKYRRRKNYRRLRGHRQHTTTVRIKSILLAGQSES